MKQQYLKPLLIFLISFISFLVSISLIYLIRYYDFYDYAFFLQYLLPLSCIGCIPMVFRRYVFGVVFLSGCCLGFLVDCILSYVAAPHPNMLSGMWNITIVVLSVFCGIVCQLIYSRRKIEKQESR